MHAVLGAAEAGTGSPDPSWGEHFQVRALGAPLSGSFRYATPFDAL
jgi:putative acetyltransferase